LLRTHRKDEPTYHSLTRAGLAFKDVISQVQLPVTDEEGVATFQTFSMIFPHELATLQQLAEYQVAFCTVALDLSM